MFGSLQCISKGDVVYTAIWHDVDVVHHSAASECCGLSSRKPTVIANGSPGAVGTSVAQLLLTM